MSREAFSLITSLFLGKRSGNYEFVRHRENVVIRNIFEVTGGCKKTNKASSALLVPLHATVDYDAAMKLSAVHGGGGIPSGSLVTEKRACKRKGGQRNSGTATLFPR